MVCIEPTLALLFADISRADFPREFDSSNVLVLALAWLCPSPLTIKSLLFPSKDSDRGTNPWECTLGLALSLLGTRGDVVGVAWEMYCRSEPWMLSERMVPSSGIGSGVTARTWLESRGTGRPDPVGVGVLFFEPFSSLRYSSYKLGSFLGRSRVHL